MSLPGGVHGVCRKPGHSRMCLWGWSSGVWRGAVEEAVGREGGADFGAELDLQPPGKPGPLSKVTS